MKTDLFCTLCAKSLYVLNEEFGEATLQCENKHRWCYSPVHAKEGDVLIWSADNIGYQCDMNYPIEEIKEIEKC